MPKSSWGSSQFDLLPQLEELQQSDDDSRLATGAQQAAEGGEPSRTQEPKRPLVWIDLEMTGLDIDNDHIIEIACLISDGKLDRVIEGPAIAIRRSNEELAQMNAWCVEHHGKSGLTQRCRDSTIRLAEAEDQVVQFVRQHVRQGQGQLAGNTVHMDWYFLLREMPRLADYLSKEVVDISSLKEVGERRAGPKMRKQPRKVMAHTALSDIRESVEELRWYSSNLFNRLTDLRNRPKFLADFKDYEKHRRVFEHSSHQAIKLWRPIVWVTCENAEGERDTADVAGSQAKVARITVSVSDGNFFKIVEGPTVDLQMTSTEAAERQILDFVQAYCNPRMSTLGGKHVYYIKAFLMRRMPKLMEFCHYRIIDVATMRSIASAWYPPQCLPSISTPNKGAGRAWIKHYLSEMWFLVNLLIIKQEFQRVATPEGMTRVAVVHRQGNLAGFEQQGGVSGDAAADYGIPEGEQLPQAQNPPAGFRGGSVSVVVD